MKFVKISLLPAQGLTYIIFLFMRNHVKENMLDRIQKVNYFVIILDSTPDISHTDQMSFICRYFVVEDKEVDV